MRTVSDLPPADHARLRATAAHLRRGRRLAGPPLRDGHGAHGDGRSRMRGPGLDSHREGTRRFRRACVGGPRRGSARAHAGDGDRAPRSREGLRAFVGPGAALRAYGVGLWLASLVVALAVFGSTLRRTTHQHALAGVTFACGAAALALGTAVVCARIVAILRNAAPGTRRALSTALAALVIAGLAWVGLAFLRAVTSDPASVAASGTVVDILAFLLAALLASRVSFASLASFAPRRALALVGPPVAVAVTALGLSVLREAPLRMAVEDRAPAFAPAVAWVQEP